MSQSAENDAPLADTEAALMRLFNQAYHTAGSREGRQAALRDWHTVREASAQAWTEGFDRGFYDPLAGHGAEGRDASESAARNPYETCVIPPARGDDA